MSPTRFIRPAGIAATAASLCVLAGAAGTWIIVAIGFISLVIVSRGNTHAGARIREYRVWLFCTIVFLATVAALSPAADLGAVSIALCMFSPLFGTMVYAMDRALTVALR